MTPNQFTTAALGWIAAVASVLTTLVATLAVLWPKIKALEEQLQGHHEQLQQLTSAESQPPTKPTAS